MRDYAGFFKLCEIAYFMRYKVNYANIIILDTLLTDTYQSRDTNLMGTYQNK